MSGTAFKMDMGPLLKLKDMGQKLQAGRLAMAKDIGAAMVSSTVRRFVLTVDPEGKPWKQNLRGGKILTQTARLRNSIAYEASTDDVIWGTNVEYAAIHQHGGEIKPKRAKTLSFKLGGRKVFTKKVTIVARPFLGVSDDDWKEVSAIIHEHLEKALT